MADPATTFSTSDECAARFGLEVTHSANTFPATTTINRCRYSAYAKILQICGSSIVDSNNFLKEMEIEIVARTLEHMHKNHMADQAQGIRDETIYLTKDEENDLIRFSGEFPFGCWTPGANT